MYACVQCTGIISCLPDNVRVMMMTMTVENEVYSDRRGINTFRFPEIVKSNKASQASLNVE